MSATYLDPLTDLLADVFSTVGYQQRGLPPTTVRDPYTVEANVADAVAVVDQVAGERAWIVGHSWGGHLALHMLVACPERLEGAIILDPLGAYLEVFEEFGEHMTAPLSDAQRARAEEIDAKEERGEATPEESREAFSLVWPSYFADPATAPPAPDLPFDVAAFAGTIASVREHEQAGTLTPRPAARAQLDTGAVRARRKEPDAGPHDDHDGRADTPRARRDPAQRRAHALARRPGGNARRDLAVRRGVSLASGVAPRFAAGPVWSVAGRRSRIPEGGTASVPRRSVVARPATRRSPRTGLRRRGPSRACRRPRAR
jgi:pimeloyl-ACP methyl ester carboxylesterase